jgi:long-subunit fatty acid transport protein
MKRALILALVLGLASILAGRADAQFESALLSKLQLNLVNPGGKSQAMGGAFVSLADDPTAAIANPAGLWQLQSWQVGFSGKNFWYQPTLDSSIYSRQSATQAFQFDAASSGAYEPKGTVPSIEFFSVAGPISENVTVAAYMATNLRYRIDAFEDDFISNYRYVGFQQANPPLTTTYDEEGQIDITNTVYGASIGGKVGRFSGGVGFTLNHLSFDLEGGDAGRTYRSIIRVGSTGFDDQLTTSVDTQNRIGFIVGGRYEIDEKYRINLGGVYRNNPKWDIGYTRTRTILNGASTTTSCATDTRFCGTFDLPDDFSFGISGMPAKNLILALDVERVMYSQLNDSFVPLQVYAIDPSKTTTCDKAGDAGCSNRAVVQGETDDVTVIRFGAEYTWIMDSGPALSFRAGYYRDPAHAMKMRLYPDTDGDRRADGGSNSVSIPNPPGFPFDQAFAQNFDGGEAEDHFTFGLGASFGRMFSMDLSADIGSQHTSATASLFLRF